MNPSVCFHCFLEDIYSLKIRHPFAQFCCSDFSVFLQQTCALDKKTIQQLHNLARPWAIFNTWHTCSPNMMTFNFWLCWNVILLRTHDCVVANVVKKSSRFRAGLNNILPRLFHCVHDGDLWGSIGCKSVTHSWTLPEWKVWLFMDHQRWMENIDECWMLQAEDNSIISSLRDPPSRNKTTKA